MPARVIWLCLATALALVACEDAAPAPVADVGSACARGADCESGLCVQVAAENYRCSQFCNAASDCTEGWDCQVPDITTTDGSEVRVCGCTPNAREEICDDGIDNDCDGQIDDCISCGGRRFAPTDPAHCGACYTSCRSDQTCREGQCECTNGATDEACTVLPECETAADCVDGIDCTDDYCGDGRCFHTVAPTRCGAAEVCDLRTGGCRAGTPCRHDTDCLDGDPCTTGKVCSGGVCMWRPLDSDRDGDPPYGCGGFDCDDRDHRTRSGAIELCDSRDNDCDGEVDSPIDGLSACGSEGTVCTAGSCECDEGFVACGIGCADLSRNALHCGFCGNACPDGVDCVDGECDCGNGEIACSGTCIDPDTDATHCGGCFSPCGTGYTCEEGSCVDVDECADDTAEDCGENAHCVNTPGSTTCECDTGYADYGRGCQNIFECTQSPYPCDPNATCEDVVGSYTCACSDGFTGDGTTCDDVLECDAIDCGEHGECVEQVGSYTCDCDDGYSFDGEDDCVLTDACRAGLQPGHAFCGGSCVDITQSETHCGDCNVACAAGSVCVDGSCGCSLAAATYCAGDGCVDLQISAQHCGECGNVCPSGASCTGGQCRCPSGQTACGDSCIDTQVSSLHCGGCDMACATGASCSAGSCECPRNQLACDGACRQVATDESYCGDCATACAAGATCSAGSCECPEGELVCDDSCTDVSRTKTACGNCSRSCSVACREGACATVRDVVTGPNYKTCAIFNDGTSSCWGNGQGYATGNGTTSASDDAVPLVRSGGSLLTDVTAISLGVTHGCAISNGDLFCWGSNAYYATGTTLNYTSYPSPTYYGVELVAVGRYHSCLQTTDGTLYCIGRRYLSGSNTSSAAGEASVMPVSGLSNVGELVAGESHTCALKGGYVYCWGNNDRGQLGTGDAITAYVPVQVPDLSGVRTIAAGGNTTCALMGDRTVRCWGDNGDGQLGIGTNTLSRSPVPMTGVTGARTVSTGSSTCMTFVDDSPAVCAGRNVNGELGIDTTVSTPWADATPELDGHIPRRMHTGNGHTCAVTATGRLFCWGDNRSYQLGMRAPSQSNTPLEVPF